MSRPEFLLDGVAVPFDEGQMILEAGRAAGRYIPHLCWHPDFPPHGSCKLCVVKVAGRHVSACATPARAGAEVESDTPEINAERRMLLQLLFVEGNHFCPACEKSGQCQLQAMAYDLEMTTPRFRHFYPDRPVDASHPEVLLDFNRCIYCELCVRASREQDGKSVFALTGRGIHKHLAVNAESGRLADTDFSADDKAAHICPVGVILKKRVGFAVPIGERTYDRAPLHTVAMPKSEDDA
ncbi:2Fe-2S iron-sulfur cluster-binding protein [Denitromonas iodatirespirans]|uniref:(2Fe-2S)-binding protein n=1 Tax=Denitromonas iodatirespirans TaxID=2795389 RepID=A0A944H9V5_DENI1|nr:2Fe-2S iron-sulfur cluster-binding protein [Denitromonas iodatirespirans]MBT0963624.1 (2Fe-2S)-binding protein [Denitromonas iodatirespirans]